MMNMISFLTQKFNNLTMKNMDIFNCSITNLIIFFKTFNFFLFLNLNSMDFFNEMNELELFWIIILFFYYYNYFFTFNIFIMLLLSK